MAVSTEASNMGQISLGSADDDLLLYDSLSFSGDDLPAPVEGSSTATAAHRFPREPLPLDVDDFTLLSPVLDRSISAAAADSDRSGLRGRFIMSKVAEAGSLALPPTTAGPPRHGRFHSISGPVDAFGISGLGGISQPPVPPIPRNELQADTASSASPSLGSGVGGTSNGVSLLSSSSSSASATPAFPSPMSSPFMNSPVGSTAGAGAASSPSSSPMFAPLGASPDAGGFAGGSRFLAVKAATGVAGSPPGPAVPLARSTAAPPQTPTFYSLSRPSVARGHARAASFHVLGAMPDLYTSKKPPSPPFSAAFRAFTSTPTAADDDGAMDGSDDRAAGFSAAVGSGPSAPALQQQHQQPQPRQSLSNDSAGEGDDEELLDPNEHLLRHLHALKLSPTF
ncbi:hypothetical protein HK405_008629 [Cladochytrium tenue]|nr:hypothetical protein HK405_008629 [Cladochytrium tenue]